VEANALISNCIRALPTRVGLSTYRKGLHAPRSPCPRAWDRLAVGVGHVLVDAPDDLKGDMLIAGKQVELVLLTQRELAQPGI
jgi:hypothetical protein